jgi:hypothetical protein
LQVNASKSVILCSHFLVIENAEYTFTRLELLIASGCFGAATIIWYRVPSWIDCLANSSSPIALRRKVYRNPFGENSASSSSAIIGHADIGTEIECHANVVITCRVNGTPEFKVGITNAHFDTETTEEDREVRTGWKDFAPTYAHIPVFKKSVHVDYKLDGYDAETITCSGGNRNTFSFSCYFPKFFLPATTMSESRHKPPRTFFSIRTDGHSSVARNSGRFFLVTNPRFR